jgi:hypothetical protein
LRKIALIIAALLCVPLAGCAGAKASYIPPTGTGFVTTEIRMGNFDPGDSHDIPVEIHYSVDGATTTELKIEKVDPGDTWDTEAKFNLHQTLAKLDGIIVTSTEPTDKPLITGYDETLNIKGFNPDVPQRQVSITYPIIPTFTLDSVVPDRLRAGYEYPTQEQLNEWLPAPQTFTMQPGETKMVKIKLSVPKDEKLPLRWAFFVELMPGAEKSVETQGMTVNYQAVGAAWVLVSKTPSKLWYLLGFAIIIIFFGVIMAFTVWMNKPKVKKDENI